MCRYNYPMHETIYMMHSLSMLFFSFNFFQAHLHHYTKVDGMDLGLFESAYEDLNSLVSEYNGLQTNKADSLDNIVQRLKII